MTRARFEKPNQLPAGSRSFAGMRSSSTADLTGWNRPELLRLPQPRGVDDQQHVGRARRAFAPEPLEQLLVAGLDAVDLDAGRLGEVGVQRLVGLVVARRVQVEHLVPARGRPASGSAASAARPWSDGGSSGSPCWVESSSRHERIRKRPTCNIVENHYQRPPP